MMNKKYITPTALAFLILIPILGFASASVMVVGYADPEYIKKHPQGVRKIMVHAGVNDMFFRDEIEWRTVVYLERASDEYTKAIKSAQLFPPIKEYNEDQVANKIQEEKIDAVLFIEIDKSDVTVTKGWSFSFNRFRGGGGTAAWATRSTSATIYLQDAKTKEIIWKGEGRLSVGGGRQKNMQKTAQLLGKKVASLLKNANVFAKEAVHPKGKSKPFKWEDEEE